MEILKHTSKEGKVVFTPSSVPMYAEFGEEFTCAVSSEEEYLLSEAVGSNPYKKASDFKVISSGEVLGFICA